MSLFVSLLELGQYGHKDLKTQNSPQVIASVITLRLAGLQHLNMWERQCNNPSLKRPDCLVCLSKTPSMISFLFSEGGDEASGFVWAGTSLGFNRGYKLAGSGTDIWDWSSYRCQDVSVFCSTLISAPTTRVSPESGCVYGDYRSDFGDR